MPSASPAGDARLPVSGLGQRGAGFDPGLYGAGVTQTIVARIAVSNSDDVESDEAIRRLQAELRDLEQIISVAQPSNGRPEPGTRGGELAAVGALLVTVLANHEAISGLLNYVGGWLQRRGRGRVEINLNGEILILEKATAEERRVIIEGYLRKVLPPDS